MGATVCVCYVLAFVGFLLCSSLSPALPSLFIFYKYNELTIYDAVAVSVRAGGCTSMLPISHDL